MTRISRGLVALALGCSGLLWAATPAVALAAWGIDSPGAGARLVTAERVPIVAFVDHASAEEVQRVETQFTWGGTPVGVVRRLDFLDTRELRPGLHRSRFAASFDPMSAAWFDFRPAPNGRYQLHARVQYAVQGVAQEPSPWSAGQDLVVDVPPPRPAADATLVDADTRTVAVGWQPGAAGIADFTRYVVERAGTEGGYAVVHETTDRSASRYTDAVPADGEYRYRVTMYRASAEGGELASPPGDTKAVTVRPGARTSTEPDPTGEGEPDPPPGEPGAAPGAAAPGEAGAPRAGSSWRPWVFPSRPPRQSPAPVERPRTAAPPEDDTFEEVLDYGDQPGEWEVTERRLTPTAPEGGTLTIFNVELQTERILVPVAAGLVLVLTGFHVRRFLNP